MSLRNGLVLAALALLLGTVAVVRTRRHAAPSPAVVAAQAPVSPLLEIDAEAGQQLGLKTELVEPMRLATVLDATGRIVPVESREACLGARIAGRLTAVKVRLGQRVTAGEVVAWLDSVDAAQAAAAWRDASARLLAAQTNLANRRQLAASGLYALAPLEEARHKHADARLVEAGLRTALAQARNELDAAKAELARTQKLAAGGSFTTAAVEDSRQRLAEAERAHADALRSVAEAQSDEADVAAAVQVARARLQAATDALERTQQFAATGDADRGPLEQAQNAHAEARARLTQAQAALEQAKAQVQRGEALHRDELISLNELEQRRTLVRDRDAQVQEATSALANAKAAVARQEQIAGGKLSSGRSVAEARAAVTQARAELAAAEARVARSAARVAASQAAVAPAAAAVLAVRSSYDRERTIAGERTRSDSALDQAKLRVTQAERTCEGKDREVAEAQRKVQLTQAALTREERLAEGQVRTREQLLDAEREVRAASIARDNAAEVLKLLGAADGAAGAKGAVQVPIKSPLSGVVTAVKASVGESVSADKDLLTVVDLSEVYVEADVYEKDLARVRQGQLVRLSVNTWPGEQFVGSVLSLSSALDAQTRACHVRALLRNPGWRLRPEMFASVAFVTGDDRAALTVAVDALQEVEGHKVVYVQRSPTQYEQRPVELGATTGQRVAVLTGLRSGERVVTAGSYLLKSQKLKDQLGEGNGQLSQ